MANEDYLKKRVTIYQVSKESGYSLATVSRVINNKDNVTEETKRRINEVIEKLGYKPSAIAQSLAKSKTTNIGIVIPSTINTFVSAMLSGMVEIAKIYGYQTTLFVTSPALDESLNNIVESVISSNVDGAVIFDDQLSDEDVAKLVNYSIPVSVIGREIKGSNVASIPLDYEEAIRTIVREHFLTGDEKIVFLHVKNGGSALMMRLEEIAREECVRLGKSDLFETMDVEDSSSDTYSRFIEYFKNVSDHGFFIAPRDSISCGLANAALDLNIPIPEKVQIVSVIGTKYSKLLRPSLSTCDIDMFEVGSVAMRMLTKLLNNTLKNKVFPFISQIERRDSTRRVK